MEASWVKILVFGLLFVWSCSSDSVDSEGNMEDVRPALQDTSYDVADEAVEDTDPCLQIDIDHPSWCTCQPQCCEAQLWFCPPVFGEHTYHKKEVIVDTCDANKVPCVYGHDEDCPPPEIIHMGECTEAYECPPMAQGLDYGWQWCEIASGMVGKQQVTCDKGQLYYTPCRPCSPEICDGLDNDCDGVVDEDLSVTPCETTCGAGNAVCVLGEEICFGPEPQEEICDYLDNDCDGEIDEFQRNACDECGPVPAELCDGVDNDCNGETDEDLVKACSTACGSGVQVCVGGSWAGCTALQPMPEICDGLDNDCNGQIDDGIECLCTIQDVGSLFPCREAPLLCGQGYKTCECIDPGCLEIVTTECFAICHWLAQPPGSDPDCDSLMGMPLQEEECNNFDDNCNQLIDEDLFAGCYTGPQGTLGVGICEPGLMTCLAGVWGGYDAQENFMAGMCMDEVIPQDEVCDGIDNDCDGVVDWGVEVPDTDILFIVDWSGSMGDEIVAVLTALNQFAGHYALQDALHWGLIVGPRSMLGDPEQRLFMISDISPFPDFLASFAALGNQGMDTASEMLLDAIYLSLQNISGNAPIDLAATPWSWHVGESVPARDQFNLSWRPGADRVVIVFSDEMPQSWLDPKIDVPQVISTCQATPQAKIYTFSVNEMWMWDEISAACAGTYYPLTNNTVETYNYLMEILDEICAAPAE